MAATEKEMIGGCCVCSDERGWQYNKLVYCDGPDCNVAVHQVCYGIRKVPAGEWLCRRCDFQSRGIAVSGCELCPSKEGAFKPTESNKWAHVVCALYIPEVSFGSDTTMEPVNINKVPKHRFQQVCHLCNVANRGACIKCVHKACTKYFHVTCCQTVGLLAEEASGLNSVRYIGYCEEHWPYQHLRGMLAPKEAKACGMQVDIGSDEEGAVALAMPNGESSDIGPVDAAAVATAVPPPILNSNVEATPVTPSSAKSTVSAPKRRNSREIAKATTPKTTKPRERKPKATEPKKDSAKKPRTPTTARAPRPRKRKDTAKTSPGGTDSPAAIPVDTALTGLDSVTKNVDGVDLMMSPVLTEKGNVQNVDILSDVAQTMISLAGGASSTATEDATHPAAAAAAGAAAAVTAANAEGSKSADDVCVAGASPKQVCSASEVTAAAAAAKETPEDNAAEEAMETDGNLDGKEVLDESNCPVDDAPSGSNVSVPQCTPHQASTTAGIKDVDAANEETSQTAATALISSEPPERENDEVLAAPAAANGVKASTSATSLPSASSEVGDDVVSATGTQPITASSSGAPGDDDGTGDKEAAEVSVETSSLDTAHCQKSLSSHPEPMHNLLMSQWKLGSAFLRSQAMPMNIAAVLEALQEISRENELMEQKISSLEQQRNHLVAVNSELEKPNAVSAAATPTTAGTATATNADDVGTSATSNHLSSPVKIASSMSSSSYVSATNRPARSSQPRWHRDASPTDTTDKNRSSSRSNSFATSPIFGSRSQSDRRSDRHSWGDRHSSGGSSNRRHSPHDRRRRSRSKERAHYHSSSNTSYLSNNKSLHRHSTSSPVPSSLPQQHQPQHQHQLSQQLSQQQPITLPHPAMTPASYATSGHAVGQQHMTYPPQSTGPALPPPPPVAQQQQQMPYQLYPMHAANPNAAPVPLQSPFITQLQQQQQQHLHQQQAQQQQAQQQQAAVAAAAVAASQLQSNPTASHPSASGAGTSQLQLQLQAMANNAGGVWPSA